jgi:hypothetical protein
LQKCAACQNLPTLQFWSNSRYLMNPGRMRTRYHAMHRRLWFKPQFCIQNVALGQVFVRGKNRRFACPMLPMTLVYQLVVPPSMFSIVYMLCVNLFFPLTKTCPSATFWIQNCGLNQRRLCIAWYRVRIRPGFIR